MKFKLIMVLCLLNFSIAGMAYDQTLVRCQEEMGGWNFSIGLAQDQSDFSMKGVLTHIDLSQQIDLRCEAMDCGEFCYFCNSNDHAYLVEIAETGKAKLIMKSAAGYNLPIVVMRCSNYSPFDPAITVRD